MAVQFCLEEIVDEQSDFDVDVLESRGDSPYWKHIPKVGYLNDPATWQNINKGEISKDGEIYIYTLIVTVRLYLLYKV